MCTRMQKMKLQHVLISDFSTQPEPAAERSIPGRKIRSDPPQARLRLLRHIYLSTA